ncbi:MAG: hypothetical protein Q9227_001225 [Pyrenula ochraceoflavens]
MTVVRRSFNPTTTPKDTNDTKMDHDTVSRPTDSRPSPLFLLAYLVILFLGSFYATISPSMNPNPSTSAMMPGLNADLATPKAPPINYFANKRNVFNLYFVKIGWFWTTLAFVTLVLLSHNSSTKSQRSLRTAALSQAFLRYFLVTGLWIVTTQWFFGPAWIDRGFTFTGGRCDFVTSEAARSRGIDNVELILSESSCKNVGGIWKGGWDISGHFFMLILSSGFLLAELYLAAVRSPHPSISPAAAVKIASQTSEDEKKAVGGWESEAWARAKLWARYSTYLVVILDLWMLLMTSIFFHTWVEKLSGLLISVTALYSVYFLPRQLPAWQNVVGGV